jgi:hypothetical protein
MINFVDEHGARIPSLAQLRKEGGFEVGADVARMTETFGATHFVPFSSFHRYQRDDSAWANAWTTPASDYARGFRSDRVTLLPAFVRYDCTTDSWEAIDPAPSPDMTFPSSDFGDDWDDTLDAGEERRLSRYFGAIEHLGRALDRITFRVGDGEHTVALEGPETGRAITFAVPRASLMRAIEWEIFDDLLIGNFMLTTLHGTWPSSGLYPDFTPYVTKYADNGRARSDEQLRAYFAEYRRRMGPATWLRAAVEQRAKDGVRARLSADSAAYRAAKRAYTKVKGGS